MSSNRNGERFIITNRSHSLKRKLFLFSSASLENWLQTGNGYCMTHLRRIATVKKFRKDFNKTKLNYLLFWAR